VTVLVLVRVFNCTRALYMSVLARICDFSKTSGHIARAGVLHARLIRTGSQSSRTGSSLHGCAIVESAGGSTEEYARTSVRRRAVAGPTSLWEGRPLPNRTLDSTFSEIEQFSETNIFSKFEYFPNKHF
jgi:hypothetical protein